MSQSLRIGVLGHGTIGRRVVTAVAAQSDMVLTGIVASRPTPRLVSALRSGVLLFTDGAVEPFQSAGLAVAGRLDDLLGRVDIIVDCGPRGTARSRMDAYAAHGVRALVHGGEDGDPDVCDFTSVVRSQGSKHGVARIASCNTTALARIVAGLVAIGVVRRLTAVLVRAAADSDKAGKGSPNATVVHLGATHHAKDLQRLFPAIAFETVGCHVPTNLGHLAHVFVDWADPPCPNAVVAGLAAASGVRVVDEGDGGLDELKRTGTGREGDAPDVLIWRRGVETEGRRTHLAAAIHMEAIVIPDTIDAIRQLANEGMAERVRPRNQATVRC